MMSSPATPGDSSLALNSICMPTQMPRNGRPEAGGGDDGLLEPALAQGRHARAEGTDAGEDDPGGVGDQRRDRR